MHKTRGLAKLEVRSQQVPCFTHMNAALLESKRDSDNFDLCIKDEGPFYDLDLDYNRGKRDCIKSRLLFFL